MPDGCGSTHRAAGAAGTRLKQSLRRSREVLTDVSTNLISVSVTLFVFLTTIFILCNPSEITACSVYLQLRPATNFLGTICSCLSWMQGTRGTTSLSVCGGFLSVQRVSTINHPATEQVNLFLKDITVVLEEMPGARLIRSEKVRDLTEEKQTHHPQ